MVFCTPSVFWLRSLNISTRGLAAHFTLLITDYLEAIFWRSCKIWHALTVCVQRLWVIWGQCCPRVAAAPSLPNGLITQLSPYSTRKPGRKRCLWLYRRRKWQCNWFGYAEMGRSRNPRLSRAFTLTRQRTERYSIYWQFSNISIIS